MSRTIHAPELEKNQGWLNTDRPLRFSNELKGRVVLLDFWTYCCINCMHILPDLKFLEEKYKDQPFTVIGVHSAKFENEASRETIRAAIQRYEIKHPVVIDDEMDIWQKYAARGWPHFVLIDSRGNVYASDGGEGLREPLDRAIALLLKQGRKEGTLATEPLKLNPESSVAASNELAFPGKILADSAGKRLFIADSNHNRIVVSTLPDAEGNSTLIAVIGSGNQGLVDDDFTKSEFHHPQGLAVSGDILYVADTENHVLRKVDLKEKTVKTIAGTGEQAHERHGGGKGTEQALNSPWDLFLDGDNLYVAMAGPHQIWKLDLKTSEIGAFAGSGREDIIDGSLDEAAMAQPSGITKLGGKFYSADSETSSVREIDPAGKSVLTVIGHGLFEFGDVDGEAEQARFQHCLGVTADGETLLLADTYNHKIKRVDPKTKRAKTLYGIGKPATRTDDGKLGLFEPGGLNAADGKLYIADTNNHRAIVVDLKTDAWSEIKIAGLKAPSREQKSEPAIEIGATKISSKGAIQVALNAQLPEGTHPSAEAPMMIRVRDGEHVLAQATIKSDKLPVTIELPNEKIPEKATLNVSWSLAYCTEGEAAQCIPARFNWNVPIEKSGDGQSRIELRTSTDKP